LTGRLRSPRYMIITYMTTYSLSLMLQLAAVARQRDQLGCGPSAIELRPAVHAAGAVFAGQLWVSCCSERHQV
jgi:hypothetical protein